MGDSLSHLDDLLRKATETKLYKTKHTFSTMVVFLHERLH